MDYIKNPMEIENTSMKIIESEMGDHNFTKEELSIIKRHQRKFLKSHLQFIQILIWLYQE